MQPSDREKIGVLGYLHQLARLGRIPSPTNCTGVTNAHFADVIDNMIDDYLRHLHRDTRAMIALRFACQN